MEAVQNLNVEKSNIQQFYSGTTVFLTGATGFLGKLVIEKLLRTCSDISKIYCLVRPKRDQDMYARLDSVFLQPCYNKLKETYPEFRKKVIPLAGDCSLKNLGLSDEDRNLLIREVNIILHCAATVRFTEDLRSAMHVNVRAALDIVKMCREMQSLKAMVHVSTAYSNCPHKEIEEKFYDMHASAHGVLNIVESIDDKILEAMTPTLLQQWPNTYTFSKALAENLLKTEAVGLPVVIVRPSMIIGSYKEPLVGWIDNFYGPVGIIIGTASGLIRSALFDSNIKMDTIPVDFVVNQCLAASWEAHRRYTENNNDVQDVKIFNAVSSNRNGIVWAKIIGYLNDTYDKQPYSKAMYYKWYVEVHSIRMYKFFSLLLHILPALIIDGVARCLGKKPILMKIYKKIDAIVCITAYFSCSEWKFLDRNTEALWNDLSNRDKELFCFDVKEIDWKSYCNSGYLGARVYLLNDPMETVPAAIKKFKKFKMIHYGLVTILSGLFLWFVCFCLRQMF